jgi:3-deoxy-manno-octulosonate cytidylyltransferase (CMP-KDO synthetase)
LFGIIKIKDSNTVKTTIIIPARYGSTRLPGKPLAMISGQTMLQRVVNLAKESAKDKRGISIVVATDDERIMEHCRVIDVAAVMTPVDCPTGTDRVQAAIVQLDDKPDFILNMQGDAPLTPPDFLSAMIESFAKEPTDVVTPVTRLTWDALDRLREDKKVTPFSGTCAVFDEKTGKAFWFSKNIIPAIRKEESLRQQSSFSPVYRHIGLYGYSYDMLMRYNNLSEGHFENLEGLEQLRVIEHGYTIRCVPVDYQGRSSMSGVDSPEDIIRAEALIVKHGELIK